MIARYVMDVPSAAPMRFAAVPILRRDGLIRADVREIAEASINGGGVSNYPPVVADVQFTNEGKATIYRLTGVYLGDIREARIRQPSLGTTIPIGVLRSAPDVVELKGPSLEQVRSGFVEVRNRGGQWTAIAIDWLTSGLGRTLAPRLGVQFESGALSEGRVISDVADAMTRLGVRLLRPLFPEHTGRKATNLLGEPIDLPPLDHWFVATLDLDADVANVLEQVRNTPGVREAVEDSWRYMVHLTPNSVDRLLNSGWAVGLSGHFGGSWLDWSDPLYNTAGKVEDTGWGARVGVDRVLGIGAGGMAFVGVGAEYGGAHSWLRTLGPPPGTGGTGQDINDEGPRCWMTGGYVRLAAVTPARRRTALCAQVSQSYFGAHASDPPFGTRYDWLGRSLAVSVGVRWELARGRVGGS